MKHYYTKYYHQNDPQSFSVWKITEDWKLMSCVYDPEVVYDDHPPIEAYDPPCGGYVEETISEEEFFLLML